MGEWRLLTDPTFDPRPPLQLRLGLQLPKADQPGNPLVYDLQEVANRVEGAMA